jgi:hypothetical protein
MGMPVRVLPSWGEQPEKKAADDPASERESARETGRLTRTREVLELATPLVAVLARYVRPPARGGASGPLRPQAARDKSRLSPH